MKNMEHWWNGMYKGNLKYVEENLHPLLLYPP
jgi:hypothetical protein